MISESVREIDGDTISFDRKVSDHDITFVNIYCGFNKNKTFTQTVWDNKKGDCNLMLLKVSETDWETLICGEYYVDVAFSNFT